MRIYLKSIVSLLLLALLFTVTISQTADDDEVDTSIPGYPYKIYSGTPINYAGFLPIDIFGKPKVIHYVFFPSQSDQSNDPVLVWFGGVPGCSSLLTCFHENGPFVFEPGKMTFSYNKNSWNKKANLLFF